ncbi:MAG TPA: hypothetical protein VFF73_04810, partial [Planctomycetota bacterium]|nr:hypothetical protein [Planctomycetota bacterium]
ALDGKYLTDAKSLHAFMADAVVGRTVHATLLRDGKDLELEVTIGERQTEAAPAPQGHAVGATTGLILANDGEMCFVLARTTKGWIRCRSQAIKCNRGSAFKETVAITGWIPAWIGLACVDAIFIGIPFVGWYIEYEINRSI